ncbi:MAG TPA: hypothetical protein VGR28_06990, partial [Candidatus Thermoplasmatota archaeon]|nr:hypothetical protein [Candidatus Thermoplasmatota archaeon]
EETGEGAQGWGRDPHSLGLLRDEGDGDDAFEAALEAQGFGRAGGEGILVDLGGDDARIAAYECQGYADDEAGTSEDLRPLVEDAVGVPPGIPGNGQLLDLGGVDTYTCSEPSVDCATGAPLARGDNRVWCAGELGTGTDVLAPAGN